MPMKSRILVFSPLIIAGPSKLSLSLASSASSSIRGALESEYGKLAAALRASALGGREYVKPSLL